MDIQWLQRDFGVYVVNMFDTGQAARALGLAGGFGLANLLDTFCKVKANKRFQTSDWRQRPLSKDMLQYARTDTHYLLYIRDRLENLLLGLGSGTAGLVTAYGKKMLMQVVEKSFSVSLKIYRDSKCDYHPDAVRELCLKSPAMKVGHIRSNPRALAVLMAVLRWRDATARNLDESRNYVLPNGICLRLANAQPTTVSQVLRLSLPESSLYPSMRIGTEEADSLLELIKQAIADVDAVASIPSVVTDTEMSEATGQASESRRSSVVLVGGEFGRLSKSTGRRDSVASASGDVAFIPSSLFGVLSASTAVDADAMPLAEVKQSVVQEFEACPALVKEDLDLFLAGAVVEHGAGIEEAAMEAAIAAVSFGTEFVSFKNQPSAPQMMRAKGDLNEEAADDEDIPLTVREQRKRNPEPVQAQPASKKKRTASSAASKALEFIEEELSLGSAKRKRK
jgi:ribonuclease D